MTKRAKRFERQPDTLPEPRLTSRDVAILRHVSRHRFLNSQQIMQLVGESPRIVRRLQSLFHAGYLDRPRAQLTYYASAGSSPLVYALGRKGAQVIADTDHDHDEAYRWTLKNKRAGQIFVQHTIEAADILVRLQKATATSTQIKLVTAEEIIAESPTATLDMRAPTKLTVDVAYKEKRYRLSVIPDGMLALEFRDDAEAPERSNFFLELDRETMPVMRKSKSLGKEGRQTSLLSKFLTYHAVWRQGLHKERFGWENFRVLTVTTSKKRVDTMISAVKEITDGRGSSLFLFTDQETLGDKSILDIEWRSGKGEFVLLTD
jgi:hypothetical protein